MNRLREWLNENPMVGTTIAVVVLVLAVGWLIYYATSDSGPPRATGEYWWDVDKGELVILPLVEAGDPPRVSPIQYEGQNLVEAYVFTCSECDDDNFVGYLLRYDDRARQYLSQGEAAMGEDSPIVEQGTLISGDQGKSWHPQVSRPGTQIMESLRERCRKDGGKLKRCQPM